MPSGPCLLLTRRLVTWLLKAKPRRGRLNFGRPWLDQGLPGEIAYRSGWISVEQLERQAQPMLKNGYGQYLMQVVRERVY